MDIRELRTFIAIAQAGNITRAVRNRIYSWRFPVKSSRWKTSLAASC